jgi:hypothetical protein
MRLFGLSTRSSTTVALALLAATLFLLLTLRDAGAVAGMTLTVDTTVDDPAKHQCTPAPNDCSLRGAITFANFSAGTDTINLANNATYKLTVTGANEDQNATGDLDVMESITINGNNSTIDATGLGDRVIEFYPAAIIGTDSIHEVVIKGGNEIGGGGGGGLMINSGTMTLDNVNINAITPQGMAAASSRRQA